MSAGAKALNWTSIVVGGLVGAFTGYYIYQRTMARARQLEAEEDANVRNAVAGHPPAEFMDDPETQAAATVLAQPDDGVDYFEEESSPIRRDYRNEFMDDGDVFTQGDGEEDAIDMHQQQAK